MPSSPAASTSPFSLLIIYYNFPPVKVPGALRIYNFCHATQPHFARIYGLASDNRALFQHDPGLKISGVPVTEVPTWDLRRLAALRKTSTNNPSISGSIKQSFWGRRLRRLIDSFPFNILIGDGGLIYILLGYLAAKRLVKKHGITHVFSTFRPYSDHIVAHLLKRRFPDLVWIADFRDLHIDPITQNVFFPAFQRWCNRQVLKKADLITTVSAGLEQHLSPLADRTFVLYNGILHLPEDHNGVHTGQKFTITYTGSLFFDQRDPGLLFEVLAEWMEQDQPEIELIYAGKDGTQWQELIDRYGLTAINSNRGLVALEEARRLQRNTSLNLLLTYNSPELQGNLTGKVYEYFAARRSVIALVKGVKDQELEDIFSEVDAGIVVYNTDADKKKLKDFIVNQYAIWKENGTLPDQIDQSALSRFHWPQMVRRLMKRLHA